MPNLDAEVLNEPKKQIVKDFSKDEIVQIIQNAIDKGIINLGDIGGGSEVVANPTLEGTEPNLEGLEVDGEKYKIPEGTVVEANPTLAGTESPLTGLQVGDTKYKVGGSGGLHCYTIGISSKYYVHYYTDADITNLTDLLDDFARIGAQGYINGYKTNCVENVTNGIDIVYAIFKYSNAYLGYSKLTITSDNGACAITNTLSTRVGTTGVTITKEY